MYEFVTHTWNPIKGKCSHGCTYCYMKKMCSRLNTPRLDAAELTCYLECSNFIFVGSSIVSLASGTLLLLVSSPKVTEMV